MWRLLLVGSRRAAAACRAAGTQVSAGFGSLADSPAELYKAYALKFLDSYAYFSLSLVLTLWLSSPRTHGGLGMSDVTAGTLYGAWGAMTTIYGLIAGVCIDRWGVARSLQIGFSLTLLARTVLFLTTSDTLVWWMLCGPLPMGTCLGIPVLTVGIRRYTTAANRGFAFGLFYVVMNVAALAAGPVVDLCTILLFGNDGDASGDDSPHEEQEALVAPTDENDSADVVPWTLTGYRLVILTGIVANLVAVVLAWTVREIKREDVAAAAAKETDDRQAGVDDTPPAAITTAAIPAAVTQFTPTHSSAWSILKETFESRRFWRFLVVCLLMVNIRMIFRHLDATLPKYMVREFGSHVPKGTIYSINPALIIVLVPLVTAATSGVDPLVMIHYGSYISAGSVFLLVLSTTIWSSVVFVVLLSIGEAVWSPRLYDYTMSVAKEGREGTYGALASAPLFLAKLPVGFMSGFLLREYCPAQGPRNSKIMWLIIGATTATSPVFMTVFWKYISYKDPEEDVTYTELSLQDPSTNRRIGYRDSELDDGTDDSVHDKNGDPFDNATATYQKSPSSSSLRT